MKILKALLIFGFFVPAHSFVAPGALVAQNRDKHETISVDYNNPKSYIIGDIKVSGIKYLGEERIISLTGLRKGDEITVPSEELSAILKRIWMQKYFSDVKFSIDSINKTNDTIVLGIHLMERPRVSRWIFHGVKSGDQKDLDERLKLKRGSELSEYGIKSSIDIIKRYYKEKGFMKTDVKVSQENDTIIKNAVKVTFNVERGPKVKIEKIRFEGNGDVSDWKLMKSMKKNMKRIKVR